MKILNYILSLFIGLFWFGTISAQQVSTLYFLENVPIRHTFNPALQPLSDFYLSLPVIGNTQLNVGNNSLYAGMLNLTKPEFLSLLKPITLLNANADINLFGFGFRTRTSYWNFTVTSKTALKIGLPKDLLKLGIDGNVNIVDGVPQLENNIFDMKSFGLNADTYIEAALGYSKQLNEKWSVGLKLKYLHGLATANMRFEKFLYTAGIDQWKINIDGTANYAYPDIENFDINMLTKPLGLGGAVDMGIVYRPNEKFIFGAAINDLGMISWNKLQQNYGLKLDYSLNGITNLSFTTLANGINTNTIFTDLLTGLKDSLNDTTTYNTFHSLITPRINISGEYGFLNNVLSVGLLSSTAIYNNSLYFTLTPSINVHPANWLNLSLSYSLLNGRGANIGAGLGFRFGMINTFITADYIPLNYAPLTTPLSVSAPVIGALTISSVPARTDRLNVAFGFNIVFGNKQDKDKDGVSNRRDKCPDTPHGVIVDKKGCPLDTDKDSIPDYYDKCPDTPKEAYSSIDSDGCPLDTDGDGVFDYLDKCPDTPYQAYGTVDKKGCPKDTDNDSVPDYLDKCPSTPMAERTNVDSVGCTIVIVQPVVVDTVPVDTVKAPIVDVKPVVADVDTDGDGIVDRLDRCPQLAGVASNDGCPEIKKEVRVIFQKALQGIQFETAKFIIKPLSYVILQNVARVLSENPNYMVEIQGHTDNEGLPEKNLILSENRANAVRDYLISKDIDAKRLTAKGYGQMRPVAPNSTIEGRAKNRRVEFVVSFE